MSPADDAATYRGWFPLADTDDDGRVTGQDAVSFFARSGLEKDALARAWQLADANRQGFLGPDEFVRALRVIALAQSGVAVSDITSASLDAAVADGTLTPR
jgi:EH domain-containing protein 1